MARSSTVRYSNLSDLQVGPNEITGKVTREVLAPEDMRAGSQKDVPFTCSRYGLDQDNGQLLNRLCGQRFSRLPGWIDAQPLEELSHAHHC